jgi:hypothetical protein
MQSISWWSGISGLLLSLRGSNAEAMYPCYVAMCTVKDLPALEEQLPADQLNLALTWYLEILAVDLQEFSGWQFVSDDIRAKNRSMFTVGFHELTDAMAWAMRTHQLLLHANWPDFLNQVECSKTIYHRGHDRRWHKLFSGFRVATAINKQRLTSTCLLVCSLVAFECRITCLPEAWQRQESLRTTQLQLSKACTRAGDGFETASVTGSARRSPDP